MGWFVRNEVTHHPHIEVRLETTVEEIKEDSIILQSKGTSEQMAVKNIVLAVGMRNNNKLVEELLAGEAIKELYVVGDCKIPRTMKEAFEEGAFAARRV
jgi:NADH dehydrogenase FAD-containing subunit